ncbi:antibiotic biosynthesis monooxygenase [Larkinella knui]|uniref:Antibiotic biosynthesis monooxygenase n=1 Tax=Larkinella knui TaxID=2025310 RepID=A0A3P1CV88_9BACT|nr:antibiotic biosynthesis monooxygenase [Larkinella knui]RRB17010.1 antibiotic biosynthesis monooxygenase [Larkinella knui]
MYTPIAQTPEPPYYVVVFTIVHAENLDGYEQMGEKMVQLASEQPGFLGLEYGIGDVELTISYWESSEAIRQWYAHAEHTIARDMGREKWFQAFKVRVARVERDYEFNRSVSE